MSDFYFIKNRVSGRYTIVAPKRAKRPDVASGSEPVCPFCPGREKHEEEVYRIPKAKSTDPDWKVRVVTNKYPFAPIHEIIIHSPDHHKSFDELPQEQNELIFKAFVHRYNEHMHKGQVVIFHNHGTMAGESLPHPHTQLAVLPEGINLETSRLEAGIKGLTKSQMYETSDFRIFCPETSMWPDEVWISPKKSGRVFGEITEEEISDLSMIVKRLVQIFEVRHGDEFPFNLQIYSGGDFYLRIIPRLKRLGGFELSTDVFVNTQKPEETLAFIKTHFKNPDTEKIRKEHLAEYHKAV